MIAGVEAPRAPMQLTFFPKANQPAFWRPAKLGGLPSPYGMRPKLAQQQPEPPAPPTRPPLIENPLVSFLISGAGTAAAFILAMAYTGAREKQPLMITLWWLATAGLITKSYYDLSRMGVVPKVS